MHKNSHILAEGVLFHKVKDIPQAIVRFQERMGYLPNQVWVNENDEFQCAELVVVRKKNILLHHYYLVRSNL